MLSTATTRPNPVKLSSDDKYVIYSVTASFEAGIPLYYNKPNDVWVTLSNATVFEAVDLITLADLPTGDTYIIEALPCK